MMPQQPGMMPDLNVKLYVLWSNMQQSEAGPGPAHKDRQGQEVPCNIGCLLAARTSTDHSNAASISVCAMQSDIPHQACARRRRQACILRQWSSLSGAILHLDFAGGHDCRYLGAVRYAEAHR